jgi:hypothetical protein
VPEKEKYSGFKETRNYGVEKGECSRRPGNLCAGKFYQPVKETEAIILFVENYFP